MIILYIIILYTIILLLIIILLQIVLLRIVVLRHRQHAPGLVPADARAVRGASQLCLLFITGYCYVISGGRLCTLIGVPWRGVSFSTLSTGRFVLKQNICKGAESAEHAETAGYTYEGTPTTA